MPFFSVIIPLFNKEKHIQDTLQCVLNQSFTYFEIIIINDGSTDDSLKVLKKITDSRIIIIDQENQGASHARNTGLANAKGKFIALLDADDIWDCTFLENINKAIIQYPNEYVFTSAIAYKYEKKTVPVRYSFKSKNNIIKLDYFKASQKYTILSGSSTIFKKTILKITGNFDETIKSGQDTDLWIRIGINFPIIFVNKLLVYYIYNTSSLSNTTTNITHKPKFDKYKIEEQNNHYLKKFLDNNRFSLAILSKLNNDLESYSYYRSNINESNLSLKKRLILRLPKWILKLLLQIKKLKNTKTHYPILTEIKS
ncbi:MAG: glycosyltransferase family 2 protein [Lacinutrix sp.]|uniref:glycosyltransferase family 2 protein n=1 Tax=Lacinutrix sp. TaxID=1937692 RepID=UPI0030A0E400